MILQNSFQKMDIPVLQLPNHKDEEWRFTNLDFLKDLNVNDYTNNPLNIFTRDLFQNIQILKN